jgi:hypothetical protein
MAMNIKQTSIDGKLYNVVSYEEFCQNIELNNNYSTAVQMNDTVYPVRSPLDKSPGVTIEGPIVTYRDPKSTDEQYQASKVIDLSDVSNMGELIKKQEAMRDMEQEILTSPDNITVPNISSLDSPEMKGLKEAIIAKHIDFDKYADRFGANFANDKRILKTNSITQKMLKRILKNIDVKATLTLEDASPNVANPMGKTIVIDITENGENDED